MKYIFSAIALSIVVYSCTGQKQDLETDGNRLIQSARSLMYAAKYHEAKDSILLIRKEHPKAFKSRAIGIIVLDSIELLEAQDSLHVLQERIAAEESLLLFLQSENPTRRTQQFYDQRKKVFYLKQKIDETFAKVKFFLRKIEIDKEKNQ